MQNGANPTNGEGLSWMLLSLTRRLMYIINCCHNSTSQRTSDGRGASYLARFIEIRHLNNSGETGISWQYHGITP